MYRTCPKPAVFWGTKPVFHEDDNTGDATDANAGEVEILPDMTAAKAVVKPRRVTKDQLHNDTNVIKPETIMSQLRDSQSVT